MRIPKHMYTIPVIEEYAFTTEPGFAVSEATLPDWEETDETY